MSTLIFWENKKIIINLLSAEFVQRFVCVKEMIKYDQNFTSLIAKKKNSFFFFIFYLSKYMHFTRYDEPSINTE